jgi:hypothetical protein
MSLLKPKLDWIETVLADAVVHGECATDAPFKVLRGPETQGYGSTAPNLHHATTPVSIWTLSPLESI